MKLIPQNEFGYIAYPISRTEYNEVQRQETVEDGFEQVLVGYEELPPIIDGEGNEIPQQGAPIYEDVPKYKTVTVTETVPVEVYLEGVIDVTDDEMAGLRARTHCFTDDKKAVRLLNEIELAGLAAQEQARQAQEAERQNKARRAGYMDAYRKYQAAVNYGEFAPVIDADAFIMALRNKEWAAFNNVPNALKYFAGECGFAESGLVTNN